MLGNGIKQTTATTGTGNLTLAAVTGYQSFANRFAVKQLFSYTLLDSTGLFLEAGIGYMSDATTLVRARVTDTIASNTAATAFSLTGTTTVICTPNAASMGSVLPTIDSQSASVGRFIASSGTTDLRSNATVTAALCYFMSFRLDVGGVFASMAINVATAVAASTATLGIYACNEKAYIGRLLAQTGSIDTSTTGFKTPAITPIFLPPGFYFVAFLPTHAIAVTAIGAAGYNTSAPNPFGFNGNSFTPIHFRTGGSTMPTDAPTSTSAISNIDHPAILLGLA